MAAITNKVYCFNTIGLIHDSRDVGFEIVMQVSHVLYWGANIGKRANCGKSARLCGLDVRYNLLNLCCLPPQKSVANLHDNSKSNMAAIVNKVYCHDL